MGFRHLIEVQTGELDNDVNVLFVIRVVVQRILDQIWLNPQMVGDLLQIHVMKVLQSGDGSYLNTCTFNTGSATANQRMRGDTRRQLLILDPVIVFSNDRSPALRRLIFARLRHHITFLVRLAYSL